MRILREYLGGAEFMDLATEDGWLEFSDLVVQDEEAARELARRIESEGEVTINENQPEFVERYTKLEESDA